MVTSTQPVIVEFAEQLDATFRYSCGGHVDVVEFDHPQDVDLEQQERRKFVLVRDDALLGQITLASLQQRHGLASPTHETYLPLVELISFDSFDIAHVLVDAEDLRDPRNQIGVLGAAAFRLIMRWKAHGMIHPKPPMRGVSYVQ